MPVEYKTLDEIRDIVKQYNGIQANTDWCAVCGGKLGERILITRPSHVLGCLNIVLVCSDECLEEVLTGEL